MLHQVLFSRSTLLLVPVFLFWTRLWPCVYRSYEASHLPRGAVSKGEGLLPLFHSQTVPRLISSVSFLWTVYSLLKNVVLSTQLYGGWLQQPFLPGKNSSQGPALRLGDLADEVRVLQSSQLSFISILFWFSSIFPLFLEQAQRYRSRFKEMPGQIPLAFTEFLTFGQLILPSLNAESWLILAIFPVLSIKPERLKQLWPVLSKITLTQTRSFAGISFLQSQPEGINSTFINTIWIL